MSNAEERDLYLDAYTKLERAHGSLTQAMNGQAVLPKGMTITQFGVLEVLLHKGPLTHCQIAGKILKSRGNLTLVIDNLVRDGLVERQPVAGDRRAVSVALTPEGEKSISSLFPRQAEAIHRVMGVLSPVELSTLAGLCRKLGRRLSAGETADTTPGGVP